MKCKATRMGFYNHMRIRPGVEFDLKAAEDFSHRWMEAIDFKPAADKHPKLSNKGGMSPQVVKKVVKNVSDMNVI